MAISKICASQLAPKSVEYIYSIRNPIDAEIFYIGKTVSMETRIKAHINDKINPKKVGILKSIAEAGLYPIIRPIDKTEIRTKLDKIISTHKETFWINKYLEMGWNLTNGIVPNAASTDYLIYKKCRAMGDCPPADFFFYGYDENGNSIYNMQQVNREQLVITEGKKDWRQAVLDGDYEREDFNYDDKKYKDNDPDYYEEDIYWWNCG